MNIERLAISIMATDATASVFRRVTKNIGKISKEVKELYNNGKKLQAISKGIGEFGKYAAFASGALGAAVGLHQKAVASMDMGEGMNKIAVLTGKSQAEIEVFRAKIHEIAAETGRGQEEILAASIQGRRRGMDGEQLFGSLKTAGMYATANFAKDMEH
jgi:hypothetical protein